MDKVRDVKEKRLPVIEEFAKVTPSDYQASLDFALSSDKPEVREALESLSNNPHPIGDR